MATDSTSGTLILPDFLIDNPGAAPKSGWGVRVWGEHIDAVAPWDDLRAAFPEDDRWRAARQALCPGFVDAHTHLSALLGHGEMAHPWPELVQRLDAEMVESAIESALFQCLRAGITSIGECVEAPGLIPGLLLRVAALVESWGLRAAIGYLANERDSYEEGQAGLAENAELLEEANLLGRFLRVRGYAVADGSSESSDPLRDEAKALAWDADARCLLHTQRAEQEFVWKGGQGRVFTPLHELRSMAEPSSWLVVQETEEITGLGSDGAIFDFFRVMRSARRQGRFAHSPQPLPASLIWRLATRGGAEVLGLEKVGKILPGWQADLQTIDLTFPAPVNGENLYAQMLRYGSAQSVQSVMVAGQVLVMNGVVLGVDAAHVRERAIAAARRLTG